MHTLVYYYCYLALKYYYVLFDTASSEQGCYSYVIKIGKINKTFKAVRSLKSPMFSVGYVTATTDLLNT